MIVQCKTKLKLLAEANFVVRLAYVRFVLQLGPHGIFGHKNDTRGKKRYLWHRFLTPEHWQNPLKNH